MQGRSWASAVTSKKPDPPAPKPKPPADAVAPPSPTTNGDAPPPTPPPTPNGVAPAPTPAPTPAAAPAAARAASPAPPAAASLAARKEPAYEPAPNEIMRVSLNKPTVDTKLGIRLTGDGRPRVIGLNPEGVAAKAGLVQVGDVIHTVNGQKANGHEATTKILKNASGSIRIELYRVQLPPPSAEPPAADKPPPPAAAAKPKDSAEAPRADPPPPRPNAWSSPSKAISAAPPRRAEPAAPPPAAPPPPAAEPAPPPAPPPAAAAAPSPPAPSPSLPAAAAAAPTPAAAPAAAAPAAAAPAPPPPAAEKEAPPAPPPPRAAAWQNPDATAAAVGAPTPQQRGAATAAAADPPADPPPAGRRGKAEKHADDAAPPADAAPAPEKRGKKGKADGHAAGGGAPRGGQAMGGQRGPQGGAAPHDGMPAMAGHPSCPSPPPHGWPGHPAAAAGMVPNPAVMGFRAAQPSYGGGPGAQMPAQQQFPTELMLLQGDERIRSHRDALKQRLQLCGGLGLEELEFAVRLMLMRGCFAPQGIPETMLMPNLPERFLAPPSPFRTIAELAASIPWLLRVHQTMQWVQQMPNGLMTVQRLICPAASEMGGLAAPDGVLAVDWRMVEEVMSRPETSQPDDQVYRPSMAGDPRFPRGAQPFRRAADGMMAPAPGADAAGDAAEPTPPPAEGGGKGSRSRAHRGNHHAAPQQPAAPPPAAEAAPAAA
ncbi:hypothetical protein AB1Y20_008294 [Prymnesium parvum]|uniref:PDZ domain-containing protein n=1 Tax=Prymnesium parvum TaxID=97485 RepID=A0AB34IWR1_PRYPA